jgi:hypothetical protein
MKRAGKEFLRLLSGRKKGCIFLAMRYCVNVRERAMSERKAEKG